MEASTYTINYIVVLSGHDGDDAKPYQEKDVKELLKQVREITGG